MMPDRPSNELAAQAALAVASANGLKVHDLTPIGGYANFMFKLEPYPIVARVAAAASSVRVGDGWLTREMDIANYLSRANAAAVRPWHGFPPGPYQHEGQYLTFWEYVGLTHRTVSPGQVGDALGKLHAAFGGYPAELPLLGPLEEAWAILDRPDLCARLAGADLAVIARKSQQARQLLSQYGMLSRPIHGDAHHGNLWPTDAGLVWGDLEDACLGPIEWDLACMTASSIVLGRGTAAAAALDAYAGDYDNGLLNLLVEARTLQGVAWAAVTLDQPAQNKRLNKRLEWLAR